MKSLIPTLIILIFSSCSDNSTVSLKSESCNHSVISESLCSWPFIYSESDILNVLAQDLNTTLYRVRNKHNPDIVDSVYQLSADGINLQFYKAVNNEIILNHIEISSSTFSGMKFNLTIGSSRKEIINNIRDTSGSKCDTVTLESFEGFITPTYLIFRNDSLVKIKKCHEHLAPECNANDVVETITNFVFKETNISVKDTVPSFTTNYDTLSILPNSLIFFHPNETEYKILEKFYGANYGLVEVDSDFGYYANLVNDSLKNHQINVTIAHERIFKIIAFDGTISYLDRLENGSTFYGLVCNPKKSEPTVQFHVMTDAGIFQMLSELNMLK